jgi:preprotein translocase subunit SecD
MKQLLILIIVFSFNTNFIRQLKNCNVPEKQFHSGFYLATIDTSKKLGLKLENSEEYYLIDSTNYLPLRLVDTVFYKYNSNFKGYILTMKFNNEGSKQLLEFTTKNQKQDIALLVGNKLFFVANIFEPIYTGGIDLASNFDKPQMENIQFSMNKEIKDRHSMKKLN